VIKKTIKYTDFNDQERSEDFYFHLSKADLIELQAKYRGGLEGFLTRIVASQDTEEIYGFLTEIVLKSYGKRSDDGSSFRKSAQLRDEFRSSEAFSELMMSFFTDVKNATEFINGIVPKDLVVNMRQASPPPGPRPAVSGNVFEKDTAPRPEDTPVDRDEPFVPTESMATPPQGALGTNPAARILTRSEAMAMEADELQRGLVEGRYKLS
jgi:hypothetical protein